MNPARPDPQEPPVGAGGLVGRETELTRLAGFAARARSGRAAVLWVRGEPGVGKTALLRAFAAAEPDLRFLTAVADAAEEPADRAVVAQLASQVRGGSAVGSRPDLAVLLRDACAEGPVVLVVDNVERLDDGSVSALERALPALDGAALVVLVAGPARSPEPPAVARLARARPGAAALHLDGLDLASVARLGRAVCGHDIDPATVRRLHGYTGGNPLHLRTMLGRLPVRGEPGRPPLPSAPSPPAPVREVLTDLPAPAWALLEALAVLGGVGPLPTLARLAEVADPECALRPALDAGLARPGPGHPVPVVRFVHDGDREAVYATLGPARRRALHAAAAPLVDPDAAWPHRVAAAATGDEELARELTGVALDHAADGRHGTAARYLRWAADLSERRADRERRLQLSLVHVSFAGVGPEAAAVRMLVERTAPAPLRALALGLDALLHRGDEAAAERWLRAALADTGPGDRWVPRAAAAGLAGLCARRGQAHEAMTASGFALSHGRLPVRIADCTRALAAVARARYDSPRRGLECLGHLPDDPHGATSTQLDTLAQRGALRVLSGQLREAAADLDVVLARRRPGAYLLAATNPWSYRAVLHYLAGRWDEAQDAVRRAFAEGTDEDSPHVRILRHTCAALVPAGRGEHVTAERHVREARRVAAALGGPQDRLCAALAEAVRCRALRNPAGICAALQAVHGELGLHGPAAWWGQWWRPLLIEGLIGTGQLAAAAEHLAVLRDDAADAEHLACTVVRLTAAHAAASGDLAGSLRTAAEYLDRPASPDPAEPPLERAALEHEHARRLLDVHRRTAAASLLRKARARYAALGAVPYERRVVLDLDRCPARGRFGLTRREEEVARLAAVGHSNREIANRLRIATKTVEYHLRNVFTKLAISSRNELRRVGSASEADVHADVHADLHVDVHADVRADTRTTRMVRLCTDPTPGPGTHTEPLRTVGPSRVGPARSA